ncbi:MAG: helix-hairpin-helix domain-containing protein [Acidobacteriota bacterium]
MHRLVLACGLMIALVAIVDPSAREWTASQDLPAGPGQETTVRLCQGCHPIDRVVSTRHSNAEWIAVVEKMVTEGAEGKEEELNQVIDYLTDQYGKPVTINTATAAQIVDGLGLDENDAKAIVAFRPGHPAFASWQDVASVPGVDAVWIERRQKNLTFGSVTVSLP